MSKVIIYQEGDSVCVIYPTGSVPIEEVAKKDVPEGALYKIVDASTLPADRYFRNAWRFVQNRVDVDIEAAKKVQRDVWRRMREPKLKSLDLEFMQALEAGNAVQQKKVTDAKKKLRDVTLIPLPDDLDGIRSTIPEILS